MNKKKILVIMTTPFDGYGISVVVKNYCYSLKEIVDFSFLLCSGYSNGEFSFFENNLFDVFVPKYSRNRHPLLYKKWLKSFLKNNHYDVVHAHGNSGTLYFEMSAAKKANVRIRIAHCHNASCKYKVLHYLLKPLLNKLATVKIACSDLAGKWLFNKGFSVLNNSIYSECFVFSSNMREEYRKKLNIQNDKVLLNVGRLHEQKNQLFLIEVMKKLVAKDASYKLIIVGDGPLKDTIEARIKLLGLGDNVLLVGKANNVNDYYSSSDLFLFPSSYEGFGLVAIEAEASGLGVLASKNVPVEIKVTDDVTFLDLEENIWAAEIERFFNGEIKNRSRLSESSISIIKNRNYDIVENCGKLLDIYCK